MLVTCCFFVIHCEIYKQFLSKNYLYTFFFSLYFMLKWLLRSASSSDSISFCQVLTLGSDQGLSSTAPHFHHLSDGTYLLFSLAATQAFLAARTLSSEEKKKKNPLRTLSIAEETVCAEAMETCAPQSSLLARGANFMPIYHREWEIVL